MKRYVSLYFYFLKYTLAREMAYRADFFLWSFVTFGWFIFFMTFYQLLFSHIDSIAGWSKGQIFVLQGFYFLIDFVIWGIFYANLEPLPRKISRGEIDMELTKPANTQFLLSFKQMNLNQIVNLILGILTITYGLNLAQITPSVTGVIYAIAVFLIACIFLYSGYFSTVCLTFWADRLNDIVYLFPQIREFSKLPRTAYHGWVRIALTYIIPAGLIATVPSQYLFGEPNWQLALVLIIFSFASLKLSTLIFATGLKRYSSASS